MIQSRHMTLLSNSHIHVLSLILSTTSDIYHMKTSIINSSAFSTTIKINTCLPLNTHTNNNDKSIVLLIVMLYVTYFLYNSLIRSCACIIGTPHAQQQNNYSLNKCL